MRTLSLILALSVALLTSCSSRGSNNATPEGDAWRTDVITAIGGTPGVKATELTVHDVDSGFGYKGPLLQGSFTVEGDAQAVVDAALLRASDVLGRESDGVRIKLSVIADDEKPQRIEAFGYSGIGNGRSLWGATH